LAETPCDWKVEGELQKTGGGGSKIEWGDGRRSTIRGIRDIQKNAEQGAMDHVG